MRVKQFVASDMTDIMLQIKDFFGSEAVIISNEKKNGKFFVTAALEERSYAKEIKEEFFDASNIKECISYHEITSSLGGKILSLIYNISTENNIYDERRLLTCVLEKIFIFNDILDLKNKCKLFMGTPGSGKSTTIAKIAALAKVNKLNPLIISTDNVRAGANKQLQAFASILEVPFHFAESERRLYDLYKNLSEHSDIVLVDTPGINPFKTEEIERIRGLCEVIKSDVYATLDAGKNLKDAIEISGIFKSIGADNIIPTKLDLTRRIGSVLISAFENNMCFSSASVSPSIANGLTPITSDMLASLILA